MYVCMYIYIYIYIYIKDLEGDHAEDEGQDDLAHHGEGADVPDLVV